MLTQALTPMIIALVILIFVWYISLIFLDDTEDKSKGFIFGSILVGIIFSVFIGFRLFDGVQKIDAEAEKIDKIVNEEVKKAELNKELIHTLISNELKIPSKALLIEPEEDFYKVTSSKGVYKFYFSYDETGKVIGIKEMIQVTK
jgi:hypothetical protein